MRFIYSNLISVLSKALQQRSVAMAELPGYQKRLNYAFFSISLFILPHSPFLSTCALPLIVVLSHRVNSCVCLRTSKGLLRRA